MSEEIDNSKASLIQESYGNKSDVVDEQPL